MLKKGNNKKTGKVMLSERGFGFVRCNDGSDVFLTKQQAIKVFNNEIVDVEIIKVKDKKEGIIQKIYRDNDFLFVGKILQGRNESFIQADSLHKIIIPNYKGTHGVIAKVKITTFPTLKDKAIAEIVAVIGHENSPKIENKIAIFNHEIPHIFNSDINEQLKTINSTMNLENRFDLRNHNFITIDGEDSRDFDDAVYCERTDFGWSLFVSIADVSHYVSENSPLDIESAIRGNSVYFPNEVVPMLPELLSNDLCSLKPNVDRYALTVKINFSKNGNIKSFKFFNSIIQSKARMTYNEVADILENHDDLLIDKYRSVFKNIKSLNSLYDILKLSKDKRGALEFEKRENKIIFDSKNSKIKDVQFYNRRISHKIIEEAMLAANICAAQLISKLKIPCLYRVHESPKDTKIDIVKSILQNIGLTLRGNETETLKTVQFKKMLDIAANRDDKDFIYSTILKSMPRANYQVENKGHFGLAYHEYTHFTSPIRRYADLIVHRAIKAVISSNLGDKYVQRHNKSQDSFNSLYSYNVDSLNQIGLHLSMTERRADKASKEVFDSLKCHFLSDKIGQKFTGKITHLTKSSLFVEFDQFILEGIVSYVDLPDYFVYIEEKGKIKGRKTKKEFKFGDKVEFVIIKVNNETNKVYLNLLF